ncbi:M15 family metallopeptidase [Terrimonas sp. NA20]|uniref:D-alanyl-D-alanine dipeptidase n=1 Tax=Terrimonas ginsenosidimutans TaxID=2908004 RepID=A0ABS9KTH0_9BACT|nr:M15 family metallopeptidase [Terrimonas ginsenosidimutans]MCG2615579.1 M15 family metallopeptidase [Terrimonas ginsenosidimutans]
MYNKLTKPFRIKVLLPVIFLTTVFIPGSAQDSLSKKLFVIKDVKEYLKTANSDPGKRMIELSSKVPRLVYDLRYSTRENFMNLEMYTPATAVSFLRTPAAEALSNVQKELSAAGIGVKVFDAYRPYSVTVKFWELVKDERYVANPARGSGHNRGIAIDLTLINLNNLSELPMGTGFDNFSDTAHHSFVALPADILKNRKLLRTTMEKYGFKALETEWWHYFLPEGNRFEILDISFQELIKEASKHK